MKITKLASRPVAQINVRIDRDLKAEGDAVLAEAGMSPTSIVRSLWTKLAQRGTALDDVVAALDAEGRVTTEEQAAIDAKMAVVERSARRRDELAQSLGLASIDMPLYTDGYDWRERAQGERGRKRNRRGV